jgi:hypothetical protein
VSAERKKGTIPCTYKQVNEVLRLHQRISEENQAPAAQQQQQPKKKKKKNRKKNIR